VQAAAELVRLAQGSRATFEPQIVKKRQRRLSGVDEVVLSFYAKGLTTGEISAQCAEISPVVRRQEVAGASRLRSRAS
jgi:transposase-like protein